MIAGMTHRVAVTLLARAPVPGACKTRLARTRGPEAAAALGAALALDVLESLARVRLEGCVVASPVLALTGSPAGAFTRACLEVAPAARIERQGDGDLGDRITEALARRLDEGASHAFVAGTDCLTVVALLPAALRAMAAADAVLLPALDGGFVLIGARRRLGPLGLRGVDWGTDRVLAQARDALGREGIRVATGPYGDDVDDEDGLRRLSSALSRPDAPGAPRTRAWLAAAGPAESR